jgi:ureidoacrylate peracid hydrolase
VSSPNPPVPPAHSTTILVVDMQNCFLDPKGTFGLDGMRLRERDSTVDAVRRLIADGRAQGVPVVYTRHVYEPGLTDADAATLKQFSTDSDHLVRGRWDAEIIDELRPGPGDAVVEKNRYDAFLDTDLQERLRATGTRTVVVCGVVTGVCVRTSAMAAYMRDYDVIVPPRTTTDWTITPEPSTTLKNIAPFARITPWAAR